jgi:hemoglobin/transferrin/lactoferrin receptor protein
LNKTTCINFINYAYGLGKQSSLFTLHQSPTLCKLRDLFKKFIFLTMLKIFSRFTTFLILFSLGMARSQPAPKILSSEIHGIIYNTNNVPVRDAHIILEHPPRNDVSDQNGRFELGPLDAGTYSIRIEHVSYQTLELEKVNVKPGQITVLDTIFLSTGIYQTENVIITATRTGQKLAEIIPIVTMVNRREIERRNSQTSAEALREESGIFVQKTNHGGGSAIIRGLSSNQILILVDGIRLNNSTYRLGNHQYLTTVDNNMLARIEVVHGPLSVMHGSDALGGTINLVTENPQFSEGANQINYNFSSLYATADQAKTVHAGINFITSKLVFQSGFSYKNYGDLRQGTTNISNKLKTGIPGNTQKPSAFTAYDFNGKIIYTPGIRQKLIATYQQSRQDDVPRFDKYAYNGFNKWLYTPQKRDLLYGVYENKNKLGFINSFRSTFSYHRQQEGREKQKLPQSDLTKELDDVATLGFIFQAQSAYKSHLLNYGLDLYIDQVKSSAQIIDSTQTIQATRGRFPDGARYNSLGIFLEDEYHFSKAWQLDAGIRYSVFNTDFTISQDAVQTDYQKQFRALTGSIGLMFKPNVWSSLSSNFAQGFRAPNLSDLTKYGESKGAVFEVPNLAVKPEEALSLDLNYKVNLPKLKMVAAVYYMRISDLLISAPDLYKGKPKIISGMDTLNINSKQNAGEAFITGFEWSLRYGFAPGFNFRSNLAYTYGENKTARDPVGGIPPFFGLAGLSWQNRDLFLEAYTRFAMEQNRLSKDDLDDPRIPIGGTPGWLTLNIRAEYKISPLIKVNFALDNILDRLYREHGSGINAPGRNLILGLKIKF